MNKISQLEVYEKAPMGFKPFVEVSACYLEIEGKILLLKQGLAKQETGAWGVPAGKLEKGETPEEAARRELFEETGILGEPSQFEGLGCLYMRKPEFDYVYHLFQVKLDQTPPISISQEHQSYQWLSMQDLHRELLLTGAKEGLEHYQKRAFKIGRTANVNAYLILKHQDQVLLLLRKNTGYFDDQYGLVAGHVEANESATSAMIREAYEEAGLLLKPSDLKVVHVMHRLSNRSNVDIFFECFTWEGEITNREPEKCEELKFFPIEEFPSNTIPYIRDAIVATIQKRHYSEQGWRP